MRKLSWILALMLAVSLFIPMAAPAMASPATLTVVSDTGVQITGVYNKAGGVNSFVDKSVSPLSAVRAQEPKPYPTGYVPEGSETTGSVWDTGTVLYFQNTNPGADWIWETERAEGPVSYATSDPLYDVDAARYGRVVVFEKKFNINGVPQSGTLHIAADNAYEVWINGTHLTRSATAKVAGWEISNLHEAFVGTSGWQTIGHIAVPASMLVVGANTIKITAGNEYFWGDDAPNFNNPTRSNPYAQYNPGALIFKLDVNYETISIALTPEVAFNVVGTQHTVQAQITPAAAGVTINFVVTGANPATGTATTNANGIATFIYLGTNPGQDNITAFIDFNGNGSPDVGEPQAGPVVKYWFQDNFLTGGGTIKDGKTLLWTVAGNVGYLPDGTIVGHFNIVDHVNKNHYTAGNGDFASLVFTGVPTVSPPASHNIGTFTANFTDKGGVTVPLTIVITDNDESGGGADNISVAGGPTFGGLLSGGNFQVHDGFK